MQALYPQMQRAHCRIKSYTQVFNCSVVGTPNLRVVQRSAIPCTYSFRGHSRNDNTYNIYQNLQIFALCLVNSSWYVTCLGINCII